MHIRPADPVRDAAACAAIYAPHVIPGPASFEEAAPDAREVGARIARAHAWLVADDDGAVAGYAYASPHRERAAYRWAVDVAVYVHADQRRRGVARALYDRLLPDLAERGFRAACAGIALPNDPSVRLHEACGFEPVGVYRKIGWKAGAWRDVGWWQLVLGAGDGPPDEPR